VDKKELGEHKMGGGPVLTRGSASHPLVFERLAEVAEKEKIPVSITAAPRYTSTDADAIFFSRAGVAAALISVPNRYMHSPNEMINLDDLDATAKLVAAFCRTVESADEFLVL
jgi:endoglucanase